MIRFRSSLVAVHSFLEALAAAATAFEIMSVTSLAHGVESSICLDHEPSLMGRWLYKLQKGGVANDGLWVMLSLNKLKD